MQKLYKGKVADEDEYVIGFLVGNDKIYQMCENETSKNCGLGTFGIVPETLEEVDLERYLISLGRIFERQTEELLEITKDKYICYTALLLAVAVLRENNGTADIIKQYEDIKFKKDLCEHIDNAVDYFISQAKESMKDVKD